MKKLLSLIIFLGFYTVNYCQDDTSFQAFLNKDIKQLLKEKIDSLNLQVRQTEFDLTEAKHEALFINNAAQESIRFLLFLHKLENNQPLNLQDSSFFDYSMAGNVVVTDSFQQQKTATTATVIYLIVNNKTLQFLNKNYASLSENDYAFLDAYIHLKKLYLNKKLIINTRDIDAAEAPQIVFPTPALATAATSVKDKKAIADLWLRYINEAGTFCNFPQKELKKYYAIEKIKVPDNNPDKLIDLRQKCALFIQKNYCTK